MMAVPSPKEERGAGGLQVIYVNDKSKGARKGNVRIARAHAARLNRENYRLKLAAQRAADVNATCKPDVALVVVDADGTPARLKPVLDEQASNWIEAPSDCPGCAECPHPKSRRKQRFGIGPLPQHMRAKVVMALDAMPSAVRAWGIASSTSAKVQHHLLHVMLPVMGGQGAADAWFRGFCGSQLIFHVGHVAAAFHRDLLAGRCTAARWSTEKQTMQRKGAALKILQQQVNSLPQLSSSEVDVLIFAALTLARHDITLNDLDTDMVHLYSLHFPTAEWAGLYGRVISSKIHLHAIAALVEYQGGLENVNVSGLAATIARVDLAEAGANHTRPSYPSMWNADMSELYQYAPGCSFRSEGRGFRPLSGHIPEFASDVFRELAILDAIMAHTRQLQELGSDILEHIMNVRNCVAHRLLSQPSWDEMDEPTQQQTDSCIYDICRLSCVICSSAVLFSMFPHSGWQDRLNSRLCWLHSLDVPPTTASEAMDGLVLWSLCIGAVASYEGQNSELFQLTVRQFLSERYEPPENYAKEVKDRLEEFLWSENACDIGRRTMRKQIWGPLASWTFVLKTQLVHEAAVDEIHVSKLVHRRHWHVLVTKALISSTECRHDICAAQKGQAAFGKPRFSGVADISMHCLDKGGHSLTFLTFHDAAEAPLDIVYAGKSHEKSQLSFNGQDRERNRNVYSLIAGCICYKTFRRRS